MRACGLLIAGFVTVASCLLAAWPAPGQVPPDRTIRVILVTPTPGPTATPSPFLQYGAMPGVPNPKRFIAVVAIASDAPTSTRLAVEVSGALRQSGVLKSSYAGVAVPGLATPNDIVTACALPNQSLAGVILLYAGSATSNDSFLLATRNWSHIDAEALLIRCTQKPDTGAVAQVVWADNDITGTGTRWSVNLLPMVTIASAIATLNAKSSKDTRETDLTYGAPPTTAPGVAYPSTAKITSETDKSNANANNSTLFDLAVLGSLSPLASGLNVGGGSNDALFKAAAAKLAQAFVGDLLDQGRNRKLGDAVCDAQWFIVSMGPGPVC